jgi:hypothetical protein
MPTPEQEARKREGHKPARGGHTNPRMRRENAEALASVTTMTPMARTRMTTTRIEPRRAGHGHAQPVGLVHVKYGFWPRWRLHIDRQVPLCDGR